MKGVVAVIIALVFSCGYAFAQNSSEKNVWRSPLYAPPVSPPPVFSIIGDVREYVYDLLTDERRLTLYLWTTGGGGGYSGSLPKNIFITIHGFALPKGFKLEFGRSYRFVFEGHLEERIADMDTYNAYKKDLPHWKRGIQYRVIVDKVLSIDEIDRSGKNWKTEFKAPPGIEKLLGFE